MRTRTIPNEVATDVLDWGSIKWLVTDTLFPGAPFSFGEVVVNPGQGHDTHQHDDADELLYVIDGEGAQTVGTDGPFAIGPGDTVYIPHGVEHSTFNTGWRQLRFTVTYSPGGAELVLRSLPDYEELEPGMAPALVRDGDRRGA